MYNVFDTEIFGVILTILFFNIGNSYIGIAFLTKL